MLAASVTTGLLERVVPRGEGRLPELDLLTTYSGKRTLPSSLLGQRSGCAGLRRFSGLWVRRSVFP